MTNEEIAVNLAEHKNKISNLEHRINDCEKRDETLNGMAVSVGKLATSMEHMVDEQKVQSSRLEKLEQRPAKDYQHYKQLIIGGIITLVIGYLFGQFF